MFGLEDQDDFDKQDKTTIQDVIHQAQLVFNNKKSFIILSIYLLLGLFIFVSLIIGFNAHIMHLKVESAVITSPIESIISPENGFVLNIYVTSGMEVKKGSPLVKIENIYLERDMQLAKIQVEESRLNIAYLQKLLANEKERLDLYKAISETRIATDQTTVNIAKQDNVEVAKNLKRMQYLRTKHYITDAEWDKVFTSKKNSEEIIKKALAEKELENDSFHAIEKGLYFTGNKLEGDAPNLNAQIESEQLHLKLNEDKVKIYESLFNKLTLVAPFDGFITQVLGAIGGTTDTSKPLLLIEQKNSPKQIIAYLTQDEIAQVANAGKVKIYIPATQKIYIGHVANIDRTAGFFDEVKAQFRWRDLQMDKSATVLIDINDSDKLKFNKEYRSGVPVIVYFTKKHLLF